MRIQKGIIYANFAPYDNAGNILDFLVDNFLFVAHFSFQFHNLSNKTPENVLTIYKKGRQAYRISFFNLKVPESLLFLFLPITGSLFLIQLIWFIFLLRIRGNRFDYFFSVNALTAWLGNLLKSLGVVKETVYWVWDYYPLEAKSLQEKIMRYLYWYVDTDSSKKSTNTFFLHPKLKKLRNRISGNKQILKNLIIPIGTSVIEMNIKNKDIPIIGYLGVIKKTQGIDILFDTLPKLLKEYPNLMVEIIGSGPEEKTLKKKSEAFSNRIKFYGYLESLTEIQSTMAKWSIGIATYIPMPDNPAYFTDPSKIKTYLSVAVPVILTDVTPFYKEIDKSRAGVVINYSQYEFIKAVKTILDSQVKFSKNALNLAKKYDYRKIYRNFFTGSF